MGSNKKVSPKKTIASSLKKAADDVVKKEKAKVEELKVLSKKAESKVEELKKASRTAKTKLKSKVEEIKKTASKTVQGKNAELQKGVKAKVAEVAKNVEKAAGKIASKAKPADKAPVAKVETVKAPAEFSPEYLVLMQRDPNFLHAFWDVKEERVKNAIKGKKDSLVLRLYDVSSDLTVRKNKNRKFQDIEVPADAKSWYVQNRGGAASFSASLGVKTEKGRFEPLLDAPAMQVFSYDSVKNSPKNADSVFFKASLGSAGIGGFGSSGLSSQSVSAWLEHLASSSESFFSGSLSSGSISSGSLAQAPNPASVNYGKDFFLWVKTRLIVYGGTRPDAHLQVRGEPFPLNPDGTFSFEQDLPDSTQIIPVFATDKDGDFPTTIVPVVVKRTE